MKLEKLQIYQLSMETGEKILEIVYKWNYFEKDTLGKQLVRTVDSVASNLSEGFGRFFYEENKQFCHYSRGSLSETKTWLTKSKNRKLISKYEYENFISDIDKMGKKLNSYINSIGRKSSVDLMTNDK